MGRPLFRRRSVCAACAAPTQVSALCLDCAEAFALARAAHPSSGGGPPDAADRRLVDDLDVWDAWALLGDPGHRPRLVRPD